MKCYDRKKGKNKNYVSGSWDNMDFVYGATDGEGDGIHRGSD